MDSIKKAQKQLNKIIDETGNAAEKQINNAIKNVEDFYDDTGKVLNNIGKEAQKFGDNALKSVQKIGNNISNEVQEEVNNINYNISVFNKKRLIDKHNPIFIGDITNSNFKYTPMLRIVENDKRTNNKACKNAVGFADKPKDGIKFITLLRKYLDYTSITLLPNDTGNIYYKHPYQKNTYINLENYFEFLNKARVSELQTIAQKLGASYFKASFIVQKKANLDNNIKVNGKVKNKIFAKGSVEGEYVNSIQTEALDKMGVELKFAGQQTPTVPELLYFKDDSDIESLITIRLDHDNPIKSKKIIFELKQFESIKEKEAIKLDATLKAINCSMSTAISAKLSNQNYIKLEYLIEF